MAQGIDLDGKKVTQVAFEHDWDEDNEATAATAATNTQN